VRYGIQRDSEGIGCGNVTATVRLNVYRQGVPVTALPYYTVQREAALSGSVLQALSQEVFIPGGAAGDHFTVTVLTRDNSAYRIISNQGSTPLPGCAAATTTAAPATTAAPTTLAPTAAPTTLAPTAAPTTLAPTTPPPTTARVKAFRGINPVCQQRDVIRVYSVEWQPDGKAFKTTFQRRGDLIEQQVGTGNVQYQVIRGGSVFATVGSGFVDVFAGQFFQTINRTYATWQAGDVLRITFPQIAVFNRITEGPFSFDIVYGTNYQRTGGFSSPAQTGNTGKKKWLHLEEYYTDNNQPTGFVKLNTYGQPNYIAPVIDTAFCPEPA
jgi:hypothetical protein